MPFAHSEYEYGYTIATFSKVIKIDNIPMKLKVLRLKKCKNHFNFWQYSLFFKPASWSFWSNQFPHSVKHLFFRRILDYPNFANKCNRGFKPTKVQIIPKHKKWLHINISPLCGNCSNWIGCIENALWGIKGKFLAKICIIIYAYSDTTGCRKYRLYAYSDYYRV